jgi:NADH/F420H2 dehydrogenase subunit C
MTLKYSKEKLERLRARYSDQIQEVVTEGVDVPVIYVAKEHILQFLRSVKMEEGFEYNFLSDLTAIDENPPTDQITEYGLGVLPAYRPNVPRFEVVYQLLSMQYKDRIRVKVRVADSAETPSVVSIWTGANWLEREVFDMYGIKFSGHPNLRRILMSDGWKGHPQRKDYPIKRYQRTGEALTMEEAGLTT